MAATVTMYLAEGIPPPMTLKIATIVNVLTEGLAAKAVAMRAVEVTAA